MNFNLTQIPERKLKPRTEGLTMIMDKGLSVQEARHLMDIGYLYIDIIKLGFGTAYVTPNLVEKLEVYRAFNVPVYFGGTLFEAFIIRNEFQNYINICQQFDITYIEVSDGSINIPHRDKCNYITQLTKYGTVLSEIGSKDANNIMPPYKWIELMKAELNAGSSYLISEARESGNIGIYRGSGEVREGLVQEILTEIPQEKIIWEAPRKEQQYYFLELLGCNANLGNISPVEIIALEAMRVGLRGDSFHLFLDKNNTIK